MQATCFHQCRSTEKRRAAKGGEPFRSFSNRLARRQKARKENPAACRSADLDSRAHASGLAGGLQKLLKCVSEKFYPVDEQLVGDLLHGDSGLFQVGHGLESLVNILRQARPQSAVVAKSFES